MNAEQPSLEVSAPTETKTSPSSLPAVGNLPSEWSKKELELWNVFSGVHSETKALNLSGKRALVEMTHNVCEAYTEGFTRLEIASVINSKGQDSGFTDDLMILAVTYFCPQYMNAQAN